MPLRTTGLQGLAEWHLVYLCRSRQRLIASSDPTSNQRTLSSGRLPIMGCATHRTIPPHTSTGAQTGRQGDRIGTEAPWGPASALALKLPPGASVVAIEHRRICAADRGQTPGHTDGTDSQACTLYCYPEAARVRSNSVPKSLRYSPSHPNLG